MTKKITTMAVLAALMLALTATVAFAATKYGTSGNDVLYGTPYADTLYGYGGSDTLYGKAGADKVYGGSGNDHLYGNRGNDSLYGGSGTDRIFGGYGDDFVSSVGYDSNADYVDCGPGYDTANRMPGPGAGDTFVNCEEFVY